MNNASIVMLLSVLGVLAAGVIAAFLWIFALHRRLKIFFMGKKGMDIEEAMSDVVKAVRLLCEKQKHSEEAVSALRAQLHGAVQHIGVVRFNPFGDAGGDQSFVIALLDDRRSGVVVSSLYARDGVRVYAKPVVDGASTYALSEEEKQAIKKALE